MLRWAELDQLLASTLELPVTGLVTQVVGLVIEARLPGVQVGDQALLEAHGGRVQLPAEVVGFRGATALLMPLAELDGVGMGTRVRVQGHHGGSVAVGDALLGRVVDGMGRPLDDRGPLQLESLRSLHPEPINPLARRPVQEPLSLGVRVIDGLLTVGRGQRVAILAGAGVGKSSLLGSMARHTDAQVNVISMIGERGREVREFLEHSLSPEARQRSVVVVSTSDCTPPLRLRAAALSMTIAEHFRQQGRHVLFMMDSLTRYAMAAREIGLSIGEPSTTKGYTPSVFALLPRFLERAGSLESGGSITGLYTVLVEGDDPAGDPIADTVRSIVDGHFILSRDLANQGHFPAIDVLQSVSRVAGSVTTRAHRQAAGEIRALLAAHAEKEDLISLGAYKKGSHALTDRALGLIDAIRAFCRQDLEQSSTFDETVRALAALATREAA